MTFEALATQLHNERIANLLYNNKMRVLLGEDIYTNFCVWCNGFAKKSDKTNPNAFGYFIKQENITLTELQRRHLLSKYFGYKVEYNNEKNVWEITK
jgi:hypothetical protein